MDNIAVIYYVTYILMSVALTVWVGETLSKNGQLFLLDSFNGNKPMANAVNRLLVVGFYLINLALVSMFLKYGGKPYGIVDYIELMSTKIGAVLLLIGLMHFGNIAIVYFFKLFNVAEVLKRSQEQSNSNAQVAEVHPRHFGGVH